MRKRVDLGLHQFQPADTRLHILNSYQPLMAEAWFRRDNHKVRLGPRSQSVVLRTRIDAHTG